MNQRIEVKYRKFQVPFGQRLADTPAFSQFKKAGWYVTWRRRKIEKGGLYIETLMKRPSHTAVFP